MVHFENDWDNILSFEFTKDYYMKLRTILKNEYSTQNIHPDMNNIFSAFKLTSFKDTKIVIIGQDPYHEVDQAHGLAFSVQKGVKIPPSLLNIYKELNSELGCYVPNNGFLEKWAKQGVLLLNATLTVRDGVANSHSKIGWSTFTDDVMKALNKREDPIIFLLWGNNAREKAKIITNKNHYILASPHPSPLSASRGFFGCNHFIKANEILYKLGKNKIDWQIENI